MTDEEIEACKDRYVEVMKPIFFPDDPVSQDIVRYFSSLLRVVGMEDGGWDPHLESRSLLNDLNSLFKIDLPAERFPDKDLTTWRLGLLMYSHIVEMDAPYEVIANLLRFKLGHGYHPNPFHMFLGKKQQKQYSKTGIYPSAKIDIIKQLSEWAGVPVGPLFDEFYNNRLRNAIAHSDFVLTEKHFRCRGGPGGIRAFAMPLEDVDTIVTKAKWFYVMFLGLDYEARRFWGEHKHKAFKYDEPYKGLLEILADEEGLMCGFKIHWPNNSESVYRRTKEGIDMVNCHLDLKRATIEMFVGQYARKRNAFSHLVEEGAEPVYTPFDASEERPTWAP